MFYKIKKKKNSILRQLVQVGLIQKHLCNAQCTYLWHACTNALDDPTRPSGAPGYGIQPVIALMWYNQIFKINFYLIILELLDTPHIGS